MARIDDGYESLKSDVEVMTTDELIAELNKMNSTDLRVACEEVLIERGLTNADLRGIFANSLNRAGCAVH